MLGQVSSMTLLKRRLAALEAAARIALETGDLGPLRALEKPAGV